MLRSIAAVITGFVVWVIVVSVGNLLVRTLLPGYAAAEPSMAFTLGMLVARLALGLVSSLAAGFASSVVARGKTSAVYVFAALLVLSFLPIHYQLWPKFPVWYHVIFIATLAPLVLLGAALQRRRRPSAHADSR